MEKKLKIIVAAVVIAIIFFISGMQFGKSQNNIQANNMRGGVGNFQQGMRNLQGGQGGVSAKNRSGFANGEIIKKDDKSITIKLSDGGSKIVFLTSSTTVSKMTTGENNDLEIGKNVMINGLSNADGSVAAEMIQIRPITSPGENKNNQHR